MTFSIQSIIILSLPPVLLAVNVALIKVYLKVIDIRLLLFANGLLYASAYIFFVQIPYYFLGYKEIADPMPGKGLGYTDLPYIGDMSYVLSAPELGYPFLITGLVAVAAGPTISGNRARAFVSALLISYYLLSIYYVQEYSVVSDVLE